MLTPSSRNTTPHGKWVYDHVFSGYRSGPFYSLDQLIADVKSHRNANGISTPMGWTHEFLHDLCLKSPGLDCKEDNEVHEDEVLTIIGRQLWVELHSYADAYPDEPTQQQQEFAAQWLQGWIARIPSFNRCSCRKDFDAWYAIFPAPLHSGLEFRKWAEIIHDRVNQKLQRPLKNKGNANHPIFMV